MGAHAGLKHKILIRGSYGGSRLPWICRIGTWLTGCDSWLELWRIIVRL
jgi:hypothetical protein